MPGGFTWTNLSDAAGPFLYDVLPVLILVLGLWLAVWLVSLIVGGIRAARSGDASGDFAEDARLSASAVALPDDYEGAIDDYMDDMESWLE